MLNVISDGNNVLGNQWSWLGGDILTSKDGYTRIASILLLLFPYILFNCTTLLWYIKIYDLYIPIIIIILMIISCISFCKTSLNDPGVISKQTDPYNIYDYLKGYKRYNTIPSQIEITVTGKFLKIKYCYTCNIYRNPRSVHCNICNVCINRFDHHCKWLGNCIGSNNYKSFIIFITSTFILLLLIISCTILRIIISSYEYINTPGLIESSSLLLYIIFTGWFIIGLLGYHLYLISTNQTTNEQLKSTYGNYNPWNRGFINNFIEILFKTPLIKHYFHPSLKVKDIYNPIHNVTFNQYDNNNIQIQTNNKYNYTKRCKNNKKNENIITSTIVNNLLEVNSTDRTPPEVTTTSLTVPTEVTTTSLRPAVSSSNYLSLKSRATPGDRGNESETIYGSRGEVNKGAVYKTTSGGTASEMKNSTGPQVEPGRDLRELEGEVNKEGHHGEWKTSDGDVTGKTSGIAEWKQMISTGNESNDKVIVDLLDDNSCNELNDDGRIYNKFNLLPPDDGLFLKLPAHKLSGFDYNDVEGGGSDLNKWIKNSHEYRHPLIDMKLYNKSNSNSIIRNKIIINNECVKGLNDYKLYYNHITPLNNTTNNIIHSLNRRNGIDYSQPKFIKSPLNKKSFCRKHILYNH